jgi:polyisoprenoid-binding protein YceI
VAPYVAGTTSAAGRLGPILSRKLLLGLSAAALVVLAVAAYAYQFFTPQKASSAHGSSVSLSTPSSSPSVGASLAGKWTVTSGSSAGYRATEQFVGVTGPNQAVADSTAVSGGTTIVDQGGQLVATQFKVSVDLTQLHSSDAAATRGGLQRDRFVGPNFLQTDQFPTATYQVDSVTIPAAATTGGQQQLATHGKLTIHGTTRDVDIPMTGQVTGDRIEIVGSVGIDMTSYGVQPPSLQFTSVQPKLTLAFHLFFARG